VMRMRVVTQTRQTKREGLSGELSRLTSAHPSQALRSLPVGNTAGAGFLLADVNLKPLYANNTAVSILQYSRSPSAARPTEPLQERLRFILQAESLGLEPSPIAFLSGRRRYICRPFLLESRQGHDRSPIVALLLERCPREELDPSDVSRGYHLTRREWETV